MLTSSDFPSHHAFLLGVFLHQWLEAAVFFASSSSLDPTQEQSDRWAQLARDRIDSYHRSMQDFDTHVVEYKRLIKT